MRTVWLNGEFLPEDQAKVSVFDRGLLFAQGVYEVSPALVSASGVRTRTKSSA